MKYFFLMLTFIFAINVDTKGQSDTAASSILNAYDFWVGSWEVYWMNPDSSFTYGSNEVVKTLDGKVIQENFIDPESGFKGSSLSVFNLGDSTWHQTWADNAGSYLQFTGILDGDKRIFQTESRMRNDTLIIQRMVFYDIEADNFQWDWQVSKDNGESWESVWQIFYQRKQEE